MNFHNEEKMSFNKKLSVYAISGIMLSNTISLNTLVQENSEISTEVIIEKIEAEENGTESDSDEEIESITVIAGRNAYASEYANVTKDATNITKAVRTVQEETSGLE